MDIGSFISNLAVVLIGCGAISWVVKKLGGDDQMSQQKPDSAQLEQFHSENYREFFVKTVKPLMEANASSIFLDDPKGLAQHTPNHGKRVIVSHTGRLMYVYVFGRQYSVTGGIQEPKKTYHPFSAADMKKALAPYVNNYCTAGGFPPCQDILVRDQGKGKVLIGFVLG